MTIEIEILGCGSSSGVPAIGITGVPVTQKTPKIEDYALQY